jgi:hypothetical protein
MARFLLTIHLFIMNNIKINLSIILPGSVLLSEQECSKNPKFDVISVKDTDNKGSFDVAIRKSKEAKQVIHLTQEAYDEFTSTKAPYGMKQFLWSKFSKKEKVNWHCKQICEALGGISYLFEILDS